MVKSRLTLPRREAAAFAFASIFAAILPTGAHAEPSSAPDVVAYCDPPLRHALRSAAGLFTARTRIPVHVFCAPPTLMLAQIEREVQNDLLITGPLAMDAADRSGLIKPGTRFGLGQTSLVLAGRAGEISTAPLDPPALARLLGAGKLALTDPTQASTIDGRAELARAGIALPPEVIGAANTDEVAFLLTSGAARIGLLYLTDVLAHPRLAIAAPLLGVPPAAYDAAITVITRSGNAQRLLDFLRSPDAAPEFLAAGLARPT